MFAPLVRCRSAALHESLLPDQETVTFLRGDSDGFAWIRTEPPSYIRPIAIGPRNWLLGGSVRGGRAAATVFSLAESAAA